MLVIPTSIRASFSTLAFLIPRPSRYSDTVKSTDVRKAIVTNGTSHSHVCSSIPALDKLQFFSEARIQHHGLSGPYESVVNGVVCPLVDVAVSGAI